MEEQLLIIILLGVKEWRQLVSEAAASAQHPAALRRAPPSHQLRNGGLQARLAVPAGEVLGALRHGAQPLLLAAAALASTSSRGVLPSGEQQRREVRRPGEPLEQAGDVAVELGRPCCSGCPQRDGVGQEGAVVPVDLAEEWVIVGPRGVAERAGVEPDDGVRLARAQARRVRPRRGPDARRARRARHVAAAQREAVHDALAGAAGGSVGADRGDVEPAAGGGLGLEEGQQPAEVARERAVRREGPRAGARCDGRARRRPRPGARRLRRRRPSGSGGGGECQKE